MTCLCPCSLVVWRGSSTWRIQHPHLVVQSALAPTVDCSANYGLLYAIPSSETEPCELVGQYLPTDASSSAEAGAAKGTITWVDGAATRACRHGRVLLVDNLGLADATVLERMNPLLETPPAWVLTEQGNTVQLDVHAGFRFLATLTPPVRHCGGSDIGAQGEELSPALANRLSTVHLPDPMDTKGVTEAAFKAEVQQLCDVLGGGEVDGAVAVAVCVRLRQLSRARAASGTPAPPLTLRALVRLIDLAYQLCTRRSSSFPHALWDAYRVTLGATGPSEAHNAVRELLLSHMSAAGQPAGLEDAGVAASAGLFAGASGKTVEQHVLPPSRRAHAESLWTCMQAGQPVLLEGPAAVGKTSLVVALAARRKQHVLRVNNSDTTSVQDYLGTFLPSGGAGRCIFHEGPLLQALRNGWWFLADELNLAPPAVTSLLNPLLEGMGRVQVPGTDRVVHAAPGFWFVATQNNARGYAGRQALPLALCSRMVAVAVPDFEASELEEVLLHRQDGSRYEQPHAVGQ